METGPSSSSSPVTFTRLTDESAFTRRHNHLHTTTVHHLTLPDPLPSDRPWIFTSSSATPAVFLHPLTSKPYSNFPHNLDVSQFDCSTLAVSYHLDSPYHVDKLLVCHGSKHLTKPTSFQLNNNINECTILALYGGGELQACPRFFEAEEKEDGSPWVKLSEPGVKFDDIAFHKGVIYAVGRQRRITSIDVHQSTRKISIAKTLDNSGPPRRFGWRKRFVVNGENLNLYLVVRTEEEVFKVYKRKKRVMCRNEIAWEVVKGFEGDKVLFMSRDHYFFRNAFKKFPGREYKNCIVFSEAAFPWYGLDCWEFTQSDDFSRCEDDIVIFRLNDGTFARDGENPCFPKIDWSPPAWIFDASPLPADEFRSNVPPECHSQSERGPDEDEGLKSASRDENDGGLLSDLKDLDSKVKEEQEETEYAFCNKDQYQKGMGSGSGSDSQDQEDRKMPRDSNCQDEDMHTKAKIEEDTTEGMALSLSTGEEEIVRTLLSMSSGSDAIEEGISGRNIIHLIPKPSTSCTTQSDKGDSETIKFEGFDIRSDLVPTLKKIWLKHGNIVKDTIVHNSNIIATSLEALAIMVRELEDNSAHSFSDGQARYLTSTLSDLKCMRFEVDWLSSFVETALTIHKSKSLVESLNNLRLLSSQAKERRGILLDELTKIDVEETKRKEEIEKMSEIISFYGQAMFDEPVGAGLT
ncbi:uncharacterized protein LOC141612671 [Silene latifolia]|uniref:uncharacterized protein LOC141612671 n=1 Tax=Silene latifolia TaxID=37657 RepID=UPI003D784F4C